MGVRNGVRVRVRAERRLQLALHRDMWEICGRHRGDLAACNSRCTDVASAAADDDDAAAAAAVAVAASAACLCAAAASVG